MTYDDFRHFADSWGLMALVAIFIGILIFAMRPGGREAYARIARLPLDEDKES